MASYALYTNAHKQKNSKMHRTPRRSTQYAAHLPPSKAHASKNNAAGSVNSEYNNVHALHCPPPTHRVQPPQVPRQHPALQRDDPLHHLHALALYDADLRRCRPCSRGVPIPLLTGVRAGDSASLLKRALFQIVRRGTTWRKRAGAAAAGGGAVAPSAAWVAAGGGRGIPSLGQNTVRKDD